MGTRQLPPGHQFDVLRLKQAAKLLTGKKIEITLPPSRAPGIALPCGGFHFVVGIRQVNHKFGDAGLQIFQRALVERGPLSGETPGSMVTV